MDTAQTLLTPTQMNLNEWYLWNQLRSNQIRIPNTFQPCFILIRYRHSSVKVLIGLAVVIITHSHAPSDFSLSLRNSKTTSAQSNTTLTDYSCISFRRLCFPIQLQHTELTLEFNNTLWCHTNPVLIRYSVCSLNCCGSITFPGDVCIGSRHTQRSLPAVLIPAMLPDRAQ